MHFKFVLGEITFVGHIKVVLKMEAVGFTVFTSMEGWVLFICLENHGLVRETSGNCMLKILNEP